MSEQLILDTHRILMKDAVREDGHHVNAGGYRDSSISFRHHTIAARSLSANLKSLIQEYNKICKFFDPISLASWFSYMFVTEIHPFDDGNGRISRLLLNWILLSLGFPLPTSLLGGFFNHAKSYYYGCLRAADQEDFYLKLIRSPGKLSTLILHGMCYTLSSFFEYARVESPSFQIKFNVDAETVVVGKKITLNIPENWRTCVELSHEYGEANTTWGAHAKEFRDSVIIAGAMNLCMLSNNRIPARNSRIMNALRSLLEQPSSFAEPPSPVGGTLTSWDEAIANGRAFIFLCRERLDEVLTVDLLQRTHNILMKNESTHNLGQLRNCESHVGAHIFAPPSAIDSALLRMCENYLILEFKTPYERAAWLAYEFLNIHPFDNSNGRLARLLISWSLLRDGIPFPCDLGVGWEYFSMRRCWYYAIRAGRKIGQPVYLSAIILLSTTIAWRFVSNRMLNSCK